jgi:hypothetical protein
MAKVLGPLLSLSARQTFAKTLTFSNWKGVATVRLKSQPSNPATTSQQTNRAYLAAGGKVAKATDPEEALATYLRTVTPAQQSYISYFVQQCMGSNNATVSAALTAYNLPANATVKGYFDDAASQAGVQPVNIGSESYEQITAGGVLAIAYFGAQAAGYSGATKAFADLAEADVFQFTEDMTSVTPS